MYSTSIWYGPQWKVNNLMKKLDLSRKLKLGERKKEKKIGLQRAERENNGKIKRKTNREALPAILCVISGWAVCQTGGCWGWISPGSHQEAWYRQAETDVYLCPEREGGGENHYYLRPKGSVTLHNSNNPSGPQASHLTDGYHAVEHFQHPQCTISHMQLMYLQ